ncbi:MAG: molybdopterin-dependent oxidoreductase [candidate division Zixibacteria bacterium]
MERRKFLKSISIGGVSLSLLQLDALASAIGYHEEGPYNGPLLTSFVSTTCGACPGGCGMRVRKVDNIPVGIDGNPIHPVSRGGLCPVGISSLAFLIHPDRVKQPLLRTGPRGSNEFKPIPWEEAENILLEKLGKLKDAGIPEQMLFVDSRRSGPGFDLARKFTHDFGSPNFYHSENPNSSIAANIWGGKDIDFVYDLENARSMFCFGAPVFESGINPVYYASLRSRLSDQPEGKKGNFYIIDPRLSASAAKAERWVPIKPNTYGLLALGMLNLIIKEELYDADVVDRLCVGFDDKTDNRGRKIEGFKSMVLKTYIPSFVAEKTEVPVDQIITLARLFATSPGAIAIAGDVATRTIDGVHQTWAIMALNAITGRFNKPGGITNFNLNPFKTQTGGKLNARPLVSSNKVKYPFLGGNGEIESLPDRILSNSPYPIELMIFNNVNPIYDSPNSSRFRQALQNIPFSVAFSSLHNETTALADLILPDCTFLEKNDLVLPNSDFSHQVVGLTQPIVEPLYESRQADDVLLTIGRKALAGNWKKWDSYKSYIEEKADELYKAGTGSVFSDQFKISFDSLLAERGWRRTEFKDFSGFLKQVKKTGGWWDASQLRKRQQGRFTATIDKFYLDSKYLHSMFQGSKTKLIDLIDAAGLETGTNTEYMLGAYRDFKNEDEQSQYPLALYTMEPTTTRGDGGRLDGMADMIGHYEYIKWRSWVELNPETASALGLSDRQMVWVESASGKQKLILIINPGLIPEVAAIPAGIGKQGSFQFGENIVEFHSGEREIFTGMPAISETRVKIYA